MSDKTPITDAVAEAQDWDMRVWWDLTIPRRDGDGGSRTAIKARLGDAGPEFHHVGQGAPWSYQPTTPADAASAIRLVADALSPDPRLCAMEWMAWQLNHRSDMFGFSIDGICKVALAEADELDSDIDSWVRRAKKQAENEAAEPEELVLTDDMLERMRKRCIHGR